MFCTFQCICSEKKKKEATFVPLGLIVKGCKCIQSPKGSSTCSLHKREDRKLVFHQNFFLVLWQIRRTTCLHKMDLIFRRVEHSERSNPHFENQVWATDSGKAHKRNQTDVKIKPMLSPMSAENHCKREDDFFKVGLPKLFVLHIVTGNPKYHLQAVAGCLPEPPQTVFMFLDGFPSVLVSWVDLLLSIPFHILPLLSPLGFKRALASYAQNRWYSTCSELKALFNTSGQTFLPPY